MVENRATAEARLIYFGTSAAFSLAPLRALLQAEAAVGAVVVPGNQAQQGAAIAGLPPPATPPTRDTGALPLLNRYLTEDIIHLAWEKGIPVFQVNQIGHPDTLAQLQKLSPALACVACFPWRIPASLLALPRFGFLNVHPSLLPAYRGPAPLFWALRQGERQTGVTVHRMDETLDTGPILLQATIDLPEGSSGRAADALCATLGGQLLVTAVRDWPRQRIRPKPQPAGGAHYPWPTADDFRLNCEWPARRAFNFMRGTVEWQRPYAVTVGSQTFYLERALRYRARGSLPQPVVRDGRAVAIQFNPGVLEAV